MEASGVLRIGELSRRTGVPTETLRAWERRYGLLRPGRSPSGYRLYTEADERRLHRMAALLEEGLSPAEAARVTLAREGGDGEAPAPAPAPGPQRAPAPAPMRGDLGELADRLRVALASMDEAHAGETLDRVLVGLSLDDAVTGVLLPALRGIGDDWARGAISVGQEHFASAVVQQRLLDLARGWGGSGTREAVLACMPGELHALGLISFGLLLRERGWRITYLGADTPLGEAAKAAGLRRASLVILTAVVEERFLRARAALTALCREHRVALGGAGATERAADAVGAERLAGDPVAAADALAAGA